MVIKRTPTLDGAGRLFEKFLPERLSEAAQAAMFALKTEAVGTGLTAQSVAGNVALTVAPGFTYELTPTADATITLTGATGAQVVVSIAASAYTVTLSGKRVSAGTFVAHRVTAGWVLYPLAGATALTIVTANVPTFNDGMFTYSIIGKTGVIYKVDGVVKAAGLYSVPPSTTVVITAEAAAGYTLTGAASWTHIFPAPQTISDDFSWASSASYGLNGDATSSGNAVWVSPWPDDTNAVPGAGELVVTLGSLDVTAATDTVAAGGSAYVPTYIADQRVAIDYNLTGGANAQARVHARGSTTTKGSQISAIILASGLVKYQLGQANWVDLGGGQPTTGRLALEVVGTTAKVLVNGVQVGASFSTAGYGVGLLAGMTVLTRAKVDNFEVAYL